MENDSPNHYNINNLNISLLNGQNFGNNLLVDHENLVSYSKQSLQTVSIF